MHSVLASSSVSTNSIAVFGIVGLLVAAAAILLWKPRQKTAKVHKPRSLNSTRPKRRRDTKLNVTTADSHNDTPADPDVIDGGELDAIPLETPLHSDEPVASPGPDETVEIPEDGTEHEAESAALEVLDAPAVSDVPPLAPTVTPDVGLELATDADLDVLLGDAPTPSATIRVHSADAPALFGADEGRRAAENAGTWREQAVSNGAADDLAPLAAALWETIGREATAPAEDTEHATLLDEPVRVDADAEPTQLLEDTAGVHAEPEPEVLALDPADDSEPEPEPEPEPDDDAVVADYTDAVVETLDAVGTDETGETDEPAEPGEIVEAPAGDPAQAEERNPLLDVVLDDEYWAQFDEPAGASDEDEPDVPEDDDIVDPLELLGEPTPPPAPAIIEQAADRPVKPKKKGRADRGRERVLRGASRQAQRDEIRSKKNLAKAAVKEGKAAERERRNARKLTGTRLATTRRGGVAVAQNPELLDDDGVAAPQVVELVDFEAMGLPEPVPPRRAPVS